MGQVRTQARQRALAPSASVSPATQASLTIGCENSAVDLVLADPENRRFGNDPPHHQAYDEIPGASIDSPGLEDDETGAQEGAEAMKIRNPQPGRYTLTLIGARDGTYSCSISVRLENGSTAEIRLRDKPLRREEVEQVEFSFDPQSKPGLVALDSPLARR